MEKTKKMVHVTIFTHECSNTLLRDSNSANNKWTTIRLQKIDKEKLQFYNDLDTQDNWCKHILKCIMTNFWIRNTVKL